MPLRQLLVIRSTQPENTYGRFTGEILKAEGLNGFDILDLDREPFPDLGADDLVVLTRCFLRAGEIGLLTAGIEHGARVVCLQPSWKLAQRLGWQLTCRVAQPGWVDIHEGYPGTGSPIQAHVPITLYAPPESADYEVLADAVQPDWQVTGYPAVVRQRLGQGEVALFFYDLPEAVARIRFGNPDLVSLLTNGSMTWPHACDLFEDHIDHRVFHLPQADFHGQLLAKVLTDLSPAPLARFWYYPDVRARTAAVFQSDDDFSTPDQFDELATMLREHGATGTFYLMEHTLLPDETVAAMQADGHTFAPHVMAAEVNNEGVVLDHETEWYFSFPEALKRETAAFHTRYGQCSQTLQSHCAPWFGYLNLVPLHRQLGYRLLFAYLSAPAERLNRYMCGSGRPLRFFDRDGTLHECWQQPMPTFDDASIKAQVQADPRPVIADFATLLRTALDVHHTTIPILSHPVSFSTYSRPYIEACFDMLVQEGVPIFNGDQWLAFLDRRDAVGVQQSRHADGIEYRVTDLVGPLPLLIPIASNETPAVLIDGQPATGLIVDRLGQRYLAVQLDGTPEQTDIRIQLIPDNAVKEVV